MPYIIIRKTLAETDYTLPSKAIDAINDALEWYRVYERAPKVAQDFSDVFVVVDSLSAIPVANYKDVDTRNYYIYKIDSIVNIHSDQIFDDATKIHYIRRLYDHLNPKIELSTVAPLKSATSISPTVMTELANFKLKYNISTSDHLLQFAFIISQVTSLKTFPLELSSGDLGLSRSELATIAEFSDKILLEIVYEMLVYCMQVKKIEDYITFYHLGDKITEKMIKHFEAHFDPKNYKKLFPLEKYVDEDDYPPFVEESLREYFPLGSVYVLPCPEHTKIVVITNEDEYYAIEADEFSLAPRIYNIRQPHTGFIGLIQELCEECESPFSSLYKLDKIKPQDVFTAISDIQHENADSITHKSRRWGNKVHDSVPSQRNCHALCYQVLRRAHEQSEFRQKHVKVQGFLS